MRTWTATATAEAHPEAVLHVLTDPDAASRWAPVPFDVEDDRRLKAGSRARVSGRLAGRRDGAIIQVASTASFQGIPYSSIYSATKAFILNFSEGLWAECREYGVRVLALCPGATATHFQTVAGTAHLRDPQKMQSPEEVVEVGLKALAQNRSVMISGFNNKLMIGAERLVSRNFATRTSRSVHPISSCAWRAERDSSSLRFCAAQINPSRARSFCGSSS